MPINAEAMVSYNKARQTVYCLQAKDPIKAYLLDRKKPLVIAIALAETLHTPNSMTQKVMGVRIEPCKTPLIRRRCVGSTSYVRPWLRYACLNHDKLKYDS